MALLDNPLITAELRDWWFDEDWGCVIGDIYHDKKGRWVDGKTIRTSRIIITIEHPEYLLVETMNSKYVCYHHTRLRK